MCKHSTAQTHTHTHTATTRVCWFVLVQFYVINCYSVVQCTSTFCFKVNQVIFKGIFLVSFSIKLLCLKAIDRNTNLQA